MKKFTLLLLLIIPFLGFSQFEQLITNHTFDSDISGWNSNGTANWSSTEGNNAAGSGEFIAVAGNNFRSSPNTPLEYDGDYTVNFWVKGAIGTTIKAQFFGCCGNPSGPDLAMTGNWVEYTHTFTGLTTGSNSNIRIVAVTDGTFYIDDAYFTFNLPAGSTLLTINENGVGSVTKTPDQPYYSTSDNVQLLAVPGTHWSFDSWGDDLSGSTNPETLLMDTNKTVTANFVIDPSFDYSFTFDSNGDLEGWTLDPQLNLVSQTGGLVTLEPTTDQFARFNLFDFPIPTSSYNKVTITLNNQSTNDDELGIIVDNGTETTVITYPLPAGSSTQVIDLTQFAAWSGDVTTFRIRFADADNPATGRSSGTGNIIVDDIIFEFDSSLSTEGLDKASFAIYPNPTKNTLHINGLITIAKVSLYDVSGKLVLESKELADNSLNVSSLKSGMYLIKITNSKNASAVKKLIIE